MSYNTISKKKSPSSLGVLMIVYTSCGAHISALTGLAAQTRAHIRAHKRAYMSLGAQ